MFSDELSQVPALYAQLFRAMGDPTRLEMIRRLASGLSDNRPYTITALSSGLDITRQGARKHLQMLADAKIVSLEHQGRDTAVHLDREALAAGKTFIAELERRWDSRLEALRRYVDENDQG
jgi:DNA-binding transcriptional ArsR family regulator